MKFENYRRAAIGDLAYIKNLLHNNPDLIDIPWDGECVDRELTGALIPALTHGLNVWVALAIHPLAVAATLFLEAIAAINYIEKYIDTHRGWTLLDFAVENGQSDVAIFLIFKGSKLDDKRLRGIASTNGCSENFLILYDQAIKDRAEKITLQNDFEVIARYAEILFQNHQKDHSGSFEYESWYADGDINSLLKFYFPTTQSEVIVLPALEWNERSRDIHMFIQTRFTNALTYNLDCFVYFLPLQIYQNHWVGLYVDRTPQKECVWWIDPMGGMPEEWKLQITDILNDTQLFENTINPDHIHVLADGLQNDAFNCGPWVIEILKFFAANKRIPTAGEIDIEVKRQEHMAILTSRQSLALSPNTLKEKKVSMQLDSFGLFGQSAVESTCMQEPFQQKSEANGKFQYSCRVKQNRFILLNA